MKHIEHREICVHIKYQNEMTVNALEDSVHLLNTAFAQFSEENHIVLSETDVASPKITSVAHGSFIIDVVLPVACALLPILYDIIKEKFAGQTEYAVYVYEAGTRMTWTDEDCYQLSKAILKEYAIRRSDKTIDAFVDNLSLSRPYKRASIKAKIQNTKQLLDENGISTTLKVTPLQHCSKTHRAQFNKARADLKI